MTSDIDDAEVCRRFGKLIMATEHDPILETGLREVLLNGSRIEDMRCIVDLAPSTWEAGERLSLELDENERLHDHLGDEFLDFVHQVLDGTDPDDPASLDDAARRINARRPLP